MGIKSTGVVGPALAGSGDERPIRLGYSAEQIMADEFEDDAKRGDLFYASVAVGGVDHQASFTTTAPFALYNPEGSDVDLIVLAVTMGYVSGTLGAGFLGAGKYFQDSLKVEPSGTVCVARGSLKLDAGNGCGKGIPLETVTLTAGTVLLFPVCDIQPKLATTAANQVPGIYDLKYRPVVTPKSAFVLSGVCGAAGTAPRVTLGCIWKQVKRIA